MKIRNICKKYGPAVVGGASVLYVGAASAAIDLTDEVATLTTDGTTAITMVGGAMLGLAALAVVYKWAKASFFG